MPKPQRWPRDEKGKPARMLRARETADVFSFLEALGKAEVVITPNGRAKGKVLATPKKWVMHLDLTVPTFTLTLTGAEGTVALNTLAILLIEDTGLADGTPLAVDLGNQQWPIAFIGAFVEGGTITLSFTSSDPENPAPSFVAGTLTVRAVL